MEQARAFFLKNIAPALGVLLIGIFGSYLLYKMVYHVRDDGARFAQIEPAAGNEYIYDEEGNAYLIIDLDQIPSY